MNQKELDHLKWIYERMQNVHGEHSLTDYMSEFRRILREAQTELTQIPLDQYEKQAVIDELLGDETNGGFIRSLCFTVWNICHNPTHEDGNSDWAEDTLPTVQEGVKRIRNKLKLLTQKEK